MKFLRHKTNEVIDLSESIDTITIRDLIGYRALDDEAKHKKGELFLQWNKTAHDRDKIFPYEDIMPNGAWANYYMDKVFTNEEYARREKYYESNRAVFNEQLDKMRTNNPNFVKMFKERFNAAKYAIVYGAPQSIVRVCMAKLYGKQVIDQLPEEDPQDAVVDPDLHNWKFV